jgi:hypothetical protein
LPPANVQLIFKEPWAVLNQVMLLPSHTRTVSPLFTTWPLALIPAITCVNAREEQHNEISNNNKKADSFLV